MTSSTETIENESSSRTSSDNERVLALLASLASRQQGISATDQERVRDMFCGVVSHGSTATLPWDQNQEEILRVPADAWLTKQDEIRQTSSNESIIEDAFYLEKRLTKNPLLQLLLIQGMVLEPAELAMGGERTSTCLALDLLAQPHVNCRSLSPGRLVGENLAKSHSVSDETYQEGNVTLALYKSKTQGVPNGLLSLVPCAVDTDESNAILPSTRSSSSKPAGSTKLLADFDGQRTLGALAELCYLLGMPVSNDSAVGVRTSMFFVCFLTRLFRFGTSRKKRKQHRTLCINCVYFLTSSNMSFARLSNSILSRAGKHCIAI